MGNCTTKTNCCAQPSILQSILRLLCSWVELFKARFITGVNTYRNINLGLTGVVISSKAVRIEDYAFFNNTGNPVFVKLYNKGDTVPTSADVPLRTLMVPAFSGENLSDLNIPFPLGLSIRGSTGILDIDVGAPVVNTLSVNIGWKLL